MWAHNLTPRAPCHHPANAFILWSLVPLVAMFMDLEEFPIGCHAQKQRSMRTEAEPLNCGKSRSELHYYNKSTPEPVQHRANTPCSSNQQHPSSSIERTLPICLEGLLKVEQYLLQSLPCLKYAEGGGITFKTALELSHQQPGCIPQTDHTGDMVFLSATSSSIERQLAA